MHLEIPENFEQMYDRKIATWPQRQPHKIGNKCIPASAVFPPAGCLCQAKPCASFHLMFGLLSCIPSGNQTWPLENGPFISDFPIKASIYRGLSIAMFDYRSCIDTEIVGFCCWWQV